MGMACRAAGQKRSWWRHSGCGAGKGRDCRLCPAFGRSGKQCESSKGHLLRGQQTPYEPLLAGICRSEVKVCKGGEIWSWRISVVDVAQLCALLSSPG